MKVKHILSLSVCSLLLLALLQVLCMAYAYRNRMQETQATLASVFKSAFVLTADAQVNRLPYPEGTMTHLVYVPDSLRLSDEDRQLHYAEQTSAVMQDAYGQPPLSADSLRRTLEGLLGHEQVGGNVYVRLLDTRTGRTLQASPAGADIPQGGIGVLTSPRAFVHRGQGVAAEAVMDTRYRSSPANLLFPLLTFLLAALLTDAIALRLRRLQRLQRDIDRQCDDYYRLAGRMEQPVHEAEAGLQAGRWTQAGDTARRMLADTEAVLSRAKQENARRAARRTRRLERPASALLALLALLLPALWGTFIYQGQRQELHRKAEATLEQAFVHENDLRYYQSLDANHLRGVPKPWLTGETDFYRRQADSLTANVFYRLLIDDRGDTLYQLRASFHFNPIYILHQPMDLSEGIRLYRAYGTQRQVNNYPVVVPVDTLRLDSLFRVELSRAGLPSEAGLRFFRPATGDVVTQTGHARIRPGSLVTAPLRLDEAGTACVQGVVPRPQGRILRSALGLYMPLGLAAAFCLLCIAGQRLVWRRQRRLEQFRKDFTYSMIHDMKSPLQSLLTGAQLMASGRLDDKPEKAARIRSAMSDECRHLLALSARVATLTQMDRGEWQLHLSDVALRPLLDDLASKFRLKAAKPVTFDIRCAEGLTVRADAFCLREALSNLIDNALKYSGPEVRVCLSAAPAPDGSIGIRVLDNGIGIPAAERHRIFDRFRRIPAGSQRTGATGFGLGLNFVQQVVRAHGGTVTVESDGSSFSRFTLTLPPPPAPAR